jgi:hypothetical protein
MSPAKKKPLRTVKVKPRAKPEGMDYRKRLSDLLSRKITDKELLALPKKRKKLKEPSFPMEDKGDGLVAISDGRRIPLQSRPQQMPKYSGDTDFDPNFVPMNGWVRRIRRQLFKRWRRSEELYKQGVLPMPDLAAAAAMKLQEEMYRVHDDVLTEALQLVYGKKAGWRVSLITEKPYEADAVAEADTYLHHAIDNNDSTELEAFAQAMKIVQDGKDASRPDRLAKAKAVLFCFLSELTGKGVPTRIEVKKWMEKRKIPFPSSKGDTKDGRFFSGAMLKRCPTGVPWDSTR